MTIPVSTTRLYDDDSFTGPRMIHFGTGITGTLLGTVATTATLVNLLKAPVNMRLVSAYGKVSNGGTGDSASPQFGILKLLAGTGAAEVALSAVYGTRADAAYLTLSYSASGTANDVTAGDVLAFGAVAGTTTDASQVFNLQTIIYEEIPS